MAIYLCELCQNLIDGDWTPCVEHPTDPTLYCCEDCKEEYEEQQTEVEIK